MQVFVYVGVSYVRACPHVRVCVLLPKGLDQEMMDMEEQLPEPKDKSKWSEGVVWGRHWRAEGVCDKSP